jgi:hypothetical protein
MQESMSSYIKKPTPLTENPASILGGRNNNFFPSDSIITEDGFDFITEDGIYIIQE